MTLPTYAAAARSRRPAPSRAPLWGLRAGAVATGVLWGSWAAVAVAAPPEGWDQPTNDSLLVALLKLVGIPLLVIAVLTLLTYLPSIMRGGRGSAGSDAWFAEHSEWFGGPRTTPEAIESRAAEVEGADAKRGGASARW